MNFRKMISFVLCSSLGFILIISLSGCIFPSVADVKVNDDWTVGLSGDYIAIEGTVTNISAGTTVNSCVVEAEFYDDKGNVVGSDLHTIWNELAPGESRPFRILHRSGSQDADLKVFIKEVR